MTPARIRVAFTFTVVLLIAAGCTESPAAPRAAEGDASFSRALVIKGGASSSRALVNFDGTPSDSASSDSASFSRALVNRTQ